MGLKTKHRWIRLGANAWRRRRRIIRLTLGIFVIALVSLSLFLVHSYRPYARIVDARLSRGYLTSRAGI